MSASTMPRLIGHRGAPAAAAENTLDSFRVALDAGLDGIELDLQRTGDGVLAVVHDPNIGPEFISGLTWAEVQERQAQVPRFEEVLELLSDFPHARLNIELKHPVPGRDERADDLARILKSWQGPAKENAWISSFDPFALLRLERLGVELPLALLTGDEDGLRLLDCLPVTGVHPSFALVNEERLRRWHDQGLFVYVWTVNDSELAKRLVRMGVDGVIGDHPGLLLEARAEGSNR